jgi:hypothetical protein
MRLLFASLKPTLPFVSLASGCEAKAVLFLCVYQLLQMQFVWCSVCAVCFVFCLVLKTENYDVTEIHDCHLGWHTLVLKCNKNNYD